MGIANPPLGTLYPETNTITVYKHLILQICHINYDPFHPLHVEPRLPYHTLDKTPVNSDTGFTNINIY